MQTRASLATLLAWHHEVGRIARGASDPSVAQAKLAWWRQEAQALAAGTAQHPLFLHLQGTASASQLQALAARLTGFVAGCERDAQQTRLLDEAAIMSHASETGGNLCEAACILLMPNASTEILAWARAQGMGSRLAHIVRALGRDARAGWLLVPVNDLQEADIKAHELLRPAPQLLTDPRYQTLMQRQTARARPMLQEPAPRSASLRGLRVFSALARALLAELERQHHPEAQRFVALTPLRKAWIAWRTR